MDFKDVKAEALKKRAFSSWETDAFPRVKQLAESKAFSKAEWQQLMTAAETLSLDVNHMVAHLELALMLSVPIRNDQNPILDSKRRQALAKKAATHAKALKGVLEEIQAAEGSTWDWELYKSSHQFSRVLEDKYRDSKFKRTLTHHPYLVRGWEGTLSACLHSMPELLDWLPSAVTEWSKLEHEKLFAARKGAAKSAKRTQFVKLLGYFLEKKYGKPLNAVIASLAGVFFPEAGEPLTEKMVSKIRGRARNGVPKVIEDMGNLPLLL